MSTRIAFAVLLLVSLPASAYEKPKPQLASRHGGSPVWDYCVGKPDDTPVPTDPRALVQPGVNEGKAVHFNTFWKDCHVDPEAVGERGPAKTCGELRERFIAGDQLLDTGSPGVGALFTATDPGDKSTTFSAQQFNELWRIWGLSKRPDNFDELVAERYGSGFGTNPNPYPKPGEDPKATNGGTGRLPEMLTQMRNTDGSWSGEIGVTCHACHSGVVGTTEDGPRLGLAFGGGSSLADLNLLLRDMLPLGWEASAAMVLNLTRSRGTNNASLINMAFVVGVHSPEVLAGVVTSGSTASMDTPAWWNMGHRPAKFVDGVFAMDTPRIDMVFYAPLLGATPESQDWMRENGPDLNTWVESLKSPPYPLPIDEHLAKEGARLFHEIDLWAPERQNPVREPDGGNGSCASCHGAYASRYVEDPAFLDMPELEGMAGNITPLDIIGTDPERVLTNNESVQQAGAKSFFGYPETAGTDQDCGPQNRADLRGDREIGYLAPPLYGVWASAPYFHNGSVPNVWEVLQPADRKPIWKRASKPARQDQRGKVIMGFDTDLDRAYDAQKLGWKYETVKCELLGLLNPMATPFVGCNPGNEDSEPLGETILHLPYSKLMLAWNLLFPPIITNQQMEDRKIYNTKMYAQGNEGHELSAVLTDEERLAILEYLKTL